MGLNLEHRGKLSQIKSELDELYKSVDILTRDSIIWDVQQRLDEIADFNVASFFAHDGEKPQWIGTIELGNSVFVSDPCYDPNIWCSEKIDNLKCGVWNVFRKVGYADGEWRIAELIIRHEDYLDGDIDQMVENSDIGVDSGQAGFFDADYYLQAKKSDTYDEWYRMVCNRTLGETNVGMLGNKCAVSSAGFGDGGYPLYVREEDGKIVGMRIEFITQECLDKYRKEWKA